MACAPHYPGGCAGEGTGKCEHLDAGIVVEGLDRNDLILNGVRCSCSDCGCAEKLEDELPTSVSDEAAKKGQVSAYSAYHSPSIGNGTRRNARRPGISDIVGAVVVYVEQGKECANGENVSELVKRCHFECG
jgi:hypothetical protein